MGVWVREDALAEAGLEDIGARKGKGPVPLSDLKESGRSQRLPEPVAIATTTPAKLGPNGFTPYHRQGFPERLPTKPELFL